jgi:nicotinate-nucleotide adenylyltransferase
MGGTFDPIHYGHLVAAQEVCHLLDLAQVVFVPAGQPPHKQGQVITPAHHRLAMVELAIASNPCFTVSRVDIDRPGPSYTVDTLRLLRQEWGPEVEITFIMGLDSLADLVSWHQPQRLIQLCYLAVVDRPLYHVDMEALEAALPGISQRIQFVRIPLIGISSSDLERRVREGWPIKYQVPPAVEEYIYKQGLYRGEGIG